MFFDPLDFPFARSFEEEWEVLRKEIDQVDSGRFFPWLERHLYNEDGWTVFPLLAPPFPEIEEQATQNRDLCPRMAQMMQEIPGLFAGGVSALEPGTRIEPHTGTDRNVVRCHFGLTVPEGDCALKVEDEVRPWVEGKWVMFDDSKQHSAWNLTRSRRLILLVDVCRSEFGL